MKEKLIELLGLEADASDEVVTNEVAYLVKVARAPGARAEKAVLEKMASGLSREDAMQVLKDQATDDVIREERDAQAEVAAKAAAKNLPPKGPSRPGQDAPNAPTPNP